jgi:hypothetical protein
MRCYDRFKITWCPLTFFRRTSTYFITVLLRKMQNNQPHHHNVHQLIFIIIIIVIIIVIVIIIFVIVTNTTQMYNYRNVSKALSILLDPTALNFSKKRVTVSTSGVVPTIVKLGNLDRHSLILL